MEKLLFDPGTIKSLMAEANKRLKENSKEKRVARSAKKSTNDKQSAHRRTSKRKGLEDSPSPIDSDEEQESAKANVSASVSKVVTHKGSNKKKSTNANRRASKRKEDTSHPIGSDEEHESVKCSNESTSVSKEVTDTGLRKSTRKRSTNVASEANVDELDDCRNVCATHAKRLKIKPKDVQLIERILDKHA